ncbi:bacteriophage abortive infection AbiH family protein [Aquaspirillum serpens]|uniref:Bacteriophage abortive infection AbiH n=1 Tax=Aquaspirillum serpens TaxID=190 RepID=E3VXA6_AQUSE|nr:bacteriophage abortive infection AbiH family protein [Aquaspirillum serpens]ADO24187.1 hypothetical protein [Aquaspirillum serpens]
MNNSILYVIGNGFDIYHGINSRYSDFKNFTRANDCQLYEIIENYYNVDDYWSDLECALANLDYDSILDDFSSLLVSYSAEDWSDADHHNYQYEINNIVCMLTDRMLLSFSNWLKQLQLDLGNFSKCQLDYLSLNGLFLNFNYTSTLEKFYCIKPENVNHIHGCIDIESDKIILGHSWNPEKRRPLNAKIDFEVMEENFVDVDTRIYEANALIDDYFLKTYKPTKRIIEDNKDFFERVSKVKRIYVLGHSISDVDIDYFKQLVSSINVKATEWYVSFYSESEKEHHQAILNRIGVPNNLIFLREINDMPKAP